MSTYRNKTEKELFVPGVGIVPAGGTVKTAVKIENSNFELVTEKQLSPKKDEAKKL